MNKDFAMKWADALESGDYVQGRGYLKTKENTYCCLGVLCEISELGTFQQRDNDDWSSQVFVLNDDESDQSDVMPPNAVYRLTGANTNHLWDIPITKEYHGQTFTNYISLTHLNDTASDEHKTFPEIAALIREHYEQL